MMQAPEAFELKCWTKSGAILEVHDAVALRYRSATRTLCPAKNFYEGTQTIKLLKSGEIRLVRVNLVFEFNNLEVFL